MKIKNLFIFAFGIILFACSASKSNVSEECAGKYKDDYGGVVENLYTTISNNDTISYTEVRFECTNSALNTIKTMYNLYGKWHQYILTSNSKHRLLLWNNIDLLSNQKKYNVFAFGVESRNTYSSILVFDKNGNDVLKNNSEEKKKIIELFSAGIRNRKNKSNQYYHEYLKDFIPEYWEKYKVWNKIKD